MPSQTSPQHAALLSQKVVETTRRLRLDLTGRRVVVEAATGAYVVSPLLAAAAGAEVVALAKETRYGTVEEIRQQTLAVAHELGVADRIRIVEALTDEDLAAAHVVTNSGHLRPLDANIIGRMQPGAVIPLMYESWEFRPGDLDLEACRKRGVQVAGTNERHPDLRIFDYLGMLAVYGLQQLKVPVVFSRLLLICQNPFAPYIARTLLACGAIVDVIDGDHDLFDLNVRVRRADEPGQYDAVVLADTPGELWNLGPRGTARFTPEQLGEFPALVQIWGDVDRTCLDDVACFPHTEPKRGHMGVLLSQLGTEPILRLQAGGLKVGQLLSDPHASGSEIAQYCQPLVSPASSLAANRERP